MRLATRALILLTAASLVFLLLVSRCGLRVAEESQQLQLQLTADQLQPESYYLDLLRRREDEHRKEVRRLKDEVDGLRKKVSDLQKPFVESVSVPLVDPPPPGGTEGAECAAHVRRQVAAAELRRGAPLSNEYEVVPFTHFTFGRVYPTALGLGKRVVEKPIGYRRKDLLEVFVRALDLLNRDRRGKQRFTVDDFAEGLYRTEPTTGTQYELHFREKNQSRAYRRVQLMRPFAAVQALHAERVRPGREPVYVVLPLSGRVDAFRTFLERFGRVAARGERGRLSLTVVYFGEAGLHEVRVLLTAARLRGAKLLTLNETFSRGKGLQAGVQHWSGKGDALLFLCDVDVAFTGKFLERCRAHAAPGRKVYYPIVFSLYNPALVYALQGRPVPPEADQLAISRDSGFWRDFGFGMTCQYRSDFLAVKGFDEDIVGWGGEDVMLYRKYVRSRLMVVRATDPGIFHLWHEKACDRDLSVDQYRSCLRSRALGEASHAQLGLLAFGDELRRHQDSLATRKAATDPTKVVDVIERPQSDRNGRD